MNRYWSLEYILIGVGGPVAGWSRSAELSRCHPACTACRPMPDSSLDCSRALAQIVWKTHFCLVFGVQDQSPAMPRL